MELDFSVIFEFWSIVFNGCPTRFTISTELYVMIKNREANHSPERWSRDIENKKPVEPSVRWDD